jgi:hypothetical protein
MPLGRAHEAYVELNYFKKRNNYQLKLRYRGGYIQLKRDELNVTAILWSTFHHPVEIQLSNDEANFVVDDLDKIQPESIEDLVRSLNNVTFIHHTELNAEDFLKTVPGGVKIMNLLGSKQKQIKIEDTELQYIMPIVKKYLDSSSFDDNRNAFTLLGILLQNGIGSALQLEFLQTNASRLLKISEAILKSKQASSFGQLISQIFTKFIDADLYLDTIFKLTIDAIKLNL